MKNYGFSTSGKSFDWTKFYSVAQATNKIDQKRLRTPIRKAFENGDKLQSSLEKDLQSVNFFKEFKEVFSLKYESFIKNNSKLFQ